MKKFFDFIKSPKFFGFSCLAIAGFLMGLLITDNIPFWVQALYIIIFWVLVGTGYYILNRLTFDKELNFWFRQCYDYKIYRECDKGEKQESDRVKVIVDDIYSLKTIIKYANLIFDTSEVDNIMITVRSNIVLEHKDEIAELFSYYETILTLNCETLENGKTASYIKILIYKKKGE